MDASARGSVYREAFDHARAILYTHRSRMQHGPWMGEDVPAEAGAMVEAISRRMRVGDKIGERPVDPRLIRRAVADALEGRGPRW